MKYLEDFKLSQTQYQFNLMLKTTTPFQNRFHAHQGIELMYIHEGTGQIILNRAIHQVHAGDLFVFQPFQLHGVQMNVSEEQPFLRTMMMMIPTFLEKYLEPFPDLLQFFRHLWQKDLPHQILYRMNETILGEVFAYFKRRMQTAPKEKTDQEVALMMLDLLHIMQSQWSGVYNYTQEKTLRHSERIMLWLEEHYGEPFHMDELAKTVHLSKSYLSHQFKEETGSSISDYLMARRIRQACLLLSTTDMDIREIGAEVGMPIPSYFTKKFKELVKTTPKQYRHEVHKLKDQTLKEQ